MNQTRLQKLMAEMQSKQVDGIALVPGPNMVYFSGIHSHLSERPIVLFLPVNAPPAIIIPGLEAMKAEKAGVPTDRIFAWSDEDGYQGAFQQASDVLNLSNWQLGVEFLHMRVLELNMIQSVAPGLATCNADPIISTLRMVKDADEVAAMERAVAVAEAAMHKLLPQIKVGQTEKQIATMLTQELMDAGADKVSFGPIVSAGPNAASPHAIPTDRPIQQGDLLIIDWGVYVDEYPSDITRTFAVGALEAEFERIYNAVKLSNEQGRKMAAPGVSGQDVDRASREVIDEAGYGQYFIHRTGHGLGLEVHEPPDMVEGNTAPLQPGNVFTIEPGIYLPGRGGVRIEDDMVVTADGVRSLTSFPRELMTVG
ncbi:MAG: Xaa-Pro peptidase family protein [Chloroflexota bacterium]